MKKIFYSAMIAILLISNVFGQNKLKKYFFASWNVENLFDNVDDTDKNDQEFTPESDKKWTSTRLTIKLNNLAKVIHAMNDSTAPDVMAFQEVEHESLIDSIIKRLPIKKYKTVYFESPDTRGIDNCLIYDSDKFKVDRELPLEISLNDNRKTRDIIYVKLKDKLKKTFHIFVNHWPSRLGGQEKSEISRMKAAETLILKINEILKKDKKANIICLGDFNDEPDNKSISETLKAYKYDCTLNKIKDYQLINLSYSKFASGEGTIKYQGDFNLIDQVIVSKALFNRIMDKEKCDLFKIFNPTWMLTKEGSFKGAAIPTYGGKKYFGGYSDHLPVTLQFTLK